MKTNRDLVNELRRKGVLHSASLIEAFLRCDRAHFIQSGHDEETYGDYPLPIGEGQTISQPTTVSIMLELLEAGPGERVLDIGSGSGWTTALLASIVGENGFVEALERLEPLVAFGRENLRRAGISNASIDKALQKVVGKPGHRYDRILVSASAPSMPEELFDQLKEGGILVIPIQNSIWKVHKNADGSVNAFEWPGFRFVPLIVS